MNGKSMFKRTIGAGAAILAMAALSPVSTAHAEGYGSSHSPAISANSPAGIHQPGRPAAPRVVLPTGPVP